MQIKYPVWFLWNSRLHWDLWKIASCKQLIFNASLAASVLSKTPWTHKQIGPHNSLLPFTAIDSCLGLFLPAGTVNSKPCIHSLPGALEHLLSLWQHKTQSTRNVVYSRQEKKSEYSTLGNSEEGADSRRTDSGSEELHMLEWKRPWSPQNCIIHMVLEMKKNALGSHNRHTVLGVHSSFNYWQKKVLCQISPTFTHYERHSHWHLINTF